MSVFLPLTFQQHPRQMLQNSFELVSRTCVIHYKPKAAVPYFEKIPIVVANIGNVEMEVGFYELTDNDKQFIAQTASQMWAEQKTNDSYRKGIINKPTEIGLELECGFAAFHGLSVNATYVERGAARDFTLFNRFTVELKSKPKLYTTDPCWFVRVQDAYGKQLPLKADYYICGFSDKQNERVGFVGYTGRQTIENLKTQESRHATGAWKNKEITFPDLLPYKKFYETYQKEKENLLNKALDFAHKVWCTCDLLGN